jgi:pSer/pThr/pTyr-binding forkhead associated (FHA) protein
VTPQVLTIGRDPSCDVVVDDEYASPRHAAVALVDGQPMVADLGSTNGTRLGPELIGSVKVVQPTPILPGMTIIVGRTRIAAGPLIERLRGLAAPIRVEATVGEPIRPAGGGAR